MFSSARIRDKVLTGRFLNRQFTAIQDSNHSLSSGGGLKVFLEWGKEVSDDRDTPRLSQQALSTGTAKVTNVSVVFGKAKQPT